MTTTRQQWRIMWPSASGDENGAQWRDARPPRDELAEWLEDFSKVWVETRFVHETRPILDKTSCIVLADLAEAAPFEEAEPLADRRADAS